MIPSRISVAAAALMSLTSAIHLLAVPSRAQTEPVDAAIVQRIRVEAFDRSRVMDTVSYLTDVIGPRLTGSPNLRRAQRYSVDLLRSWGIERAAVEAWGPFGRGWQIEQVSARMTAPTIDPLVVYPKAWSPGTAGVIAGSPVWFDAAELRDVEKYRGRLEGKIVLFSPVRTVAPLTVPEPHRWSDADLLRLASAPPGGAPDFHPTPEQQAAAQLQYEKWRLVTDEGAAVVLSPSFNSGSLTVTAATLPVAPGTPVDRTPNPWDSDPPRIVPQLVVALEQYNRMVRLVGRGVPVRLEVSLATRFDDSSPMSGNVVAEIPGSDRRGEIVMFGGCLDSWHAGTGATDNAVGAAVALEAMRILKALGVQPQRTIRLGLWSAEEQGTLGSQAYVAAHFGRLVTQPDGTRRVERGPDYDRLDGYFNVDWGPGRIRGIYLQGNLAVKPIFHAWLGPLADLGASTLSPSGIGATDHISFDRIGLPGFQFIRDFMEGGGGPGHTNLDVFDHVIADDLKQAAAVLASLVFHTAQRNQMLPRKGN